MYDELQRLVDGADTVVIIQADNPDADSLASSLALERILHDLGKQPHMFCGIDMPEYLKYLPGWDRVSKDMPVQFDLSIIVDTSSIVLLGQLEASHYRGAVATRPVIVLDHHAGVACDIPYATVALNDPSKVSTGELIYATAVQQRWPLSLEAREYIMTSILADSLGLANETTTADTYRVMAELVDAGVSRPKLEELRRARTRMPEPIFRYKAALIERTEFFHDGRLAVASIPQDEISKYSPLYNPNPLIQSEHLQTSGVLASVVFKHYASGRITAAIRTSIKAPIAASLAERFGGGGHAQAAGFKVEDGRRLPEIKDGCVKAAGELLGDVPMTEDTVTHTFE
jgi:phosphoesterase RecJ-like protein